MEITKTPGPDKPISKISVIFEMKILNVQGAGYTSQIPSFPNTHTHTHTHQGMFVSKNLPFKYCEVVFFDVFPFFFVRVSTNENNKK